MVSLPFNPQRYILVHNYGLKVAQRCPPAPNPNQKELKTRATLKPAGQIFQVTFEGNSPPVQYAGPSTVVELFKDAGPSTVVELFKDAGPSTVVVI